MTIVIEVSGGTVRSVYSDVPGVEVIVVDRDILDDLGDLADFQDESPEVLVVNSEAEKWDTGIDRLMVNPDRYPFGVF